VLNNRSELDTCLSMGSRDLDALQSLPVIKILFNHGKLYCLLLENVKDCAALLGSPLLQDDDPISKNVTLSRTAHALHNGGLSASVVNKLPFFCDKSFLHQPVDQNFLIFN